MKIQFSPVTLAEIEPRLQQHLSALGSPVDSFLEDHILTAQHYHIVRDEQLLGWASVHQGSLLTQFALLPAYRQLGQPIFAQVRRLETVQAAFVPTCDEFFLAHALDNYRQLEKQAYFFQPSPERQPYQPPPALRQRPAQADDIPIIQHLSGDFFDKLEQRVAAGQIYLTQRALDSALSVMNDEPVGFGIIEKGRLCLGVGSCGMYVVETARRQGIGAAIIADLMARCGALGLRPIAGCWYYNHNSQKTLEKAGLFTQTRLLKISF